MFLSNLPLWISGVLLVGLTSLLAMFGPVMVRRHVTLERLSTNNEVAGFKFATVGVLYAVLLAFVVIIVWEKFSEAEVAVVQEAGAAATIYRLADGMGPESGGRLRESLTGYVRSTIEQDWPAMQQGGSSNAAKRALDATYNTLLTFNPQTLRDAALLTEILNQLDHVTQARRTRLVLASGIVPGILWLVLFGGAILTVAFTFFFGTENLRAQVMMTGMLSALIFLGLLVIIAIDHPFTGTVKVEPHALSLVLEDFASIHGG